MTRDEIRAMAREVGFTPLHELVFTETLQLFATLVRNQALEDAAKRIESPLHNYADVIRKMKECV